MGKPSKQKAGTRRARARLEARQRASRARRAAKRRAPADWHVNAGTGHPRPVQRSAYRAPRGRRQPGCDDAGAPVYDWQARRTVTRPYASSLARRQDTADCVIPRMSHSTRRAGRTRTRRAARRVAELRKDRRPRVDVGRDRHRLVRVPNEVSPRRGQFALHRHAHARSIRGSHRQLEAGATTR